MSRKRFIWVSYDEAIEIARRLRLGVYDALKAVIPTF